MRCRTQEKTMKSMSLVSLALAAALAHAQPAGWGNEVAGARNHPGCMRHHDAGNGVLVRLTSPAEGQAGNVLDAASRHAEVMRQLAAQADTGQLASCTSR
jgi:hypothetical protein